MMFFLSHVSQNKLVSGRMLIIMAFLLFTGSEGTARTTFDDLQGIPTRHLYVPQDKSERTILQYTKGWICYAQGVFYEDASSAPDHAIYRIGTINSGKVKQYEIYKSRFPEFRSLKMLH